MRSAAESLVEQLTGVEKHGKAGSKADEATAQFLSNAHRLGYPSLALLASHAAYVAVGNVKPDAQFRVEYDAAAREALMITLEKEATNRARRAVQSNKHLKEAFFVKAARWCCVLRVPVVRRPLAD